MSKKSIPCDKLLGGCGVICLEVGKEIGYPKYCQESTEKEDSIRTPLIPD